MKSYPKISIVTAVFNRVQYLEESIISVLTQNYPNLEYIIIDGGSTDGTVEIIKKYESQLAYWISEPDNGMYHAIQKGFDKATGDIMAWINSDDIYHNNALKMVGDIFIELKDIDWITGTPSLFNKDGQCVKVFTTQRWSKERIAAGDYRWIQQESSFWRKSLWEKAGGYIDVNFKLASDFELWTRFFEHTTLYSVNAILAGFRLHGNQLSLNNNTAYENEVVDVFTKKYCKKGASKQMMIFKLFAFQQYCFRSSFLMRYIGQQISEILKKNYRLPKIIYYDFDINKWKKQ